MPDLKITEAVAFVRRVVVNVFCQQATEEEIVAVARRVVAALPPNTTGAGGNR